MVIEVYGGGCDRCDALERVASEAVAALGIDAQVRQIRDLGEVQARGVLSTPALIVDGRVVSAGRVPDVSEVARLLAEEAPN
jgi:small redox-active disulfide protein 2